jgi:hypothetical protein
VLPGAPLWQTGRPGDWQPATQPGRYVGRLPAGWLSVDGLATDPGAAGGAIVGSQGLAGMLVGGPGDGTARVLPVDLMAARFRAWGYAWDIPPAAGPATRAPSGGSLASLTAPAGSATGTGAVGSMPAPTPASPAIPVIHPVAPAAPPLQLAPVAVQALAPAELAARADWLPPGARLSPWASGSAPLYTLPSAAAQRLGALPPGTQLPHSLWAQGVYAAQLRLDGGAWFLVAAEGQPIGYVAGRRVIEILPPLPAGAPPVGRVLRRWSVAGAPDEATLRDAGAYDDLTVPVLCRRSFCDTVQIYTPQPPAAGAAVPTLRILPITGQWSLNEAIPVHLQLPHSLVGNPTARLLACVGQGSDCDEQNLLPAGG